MFGGWSFVKTINFIALTKPDHVQQYTTLKSFTHTISRAPRSGVSRTLHFIGTAGFIGLFAHGLVGWPRLVDGDRAGLRLWLLPGGHFSSKGTNPPPSSIPA